MKAKFQYKENVIANLQRLLFAGIRDEEWETGWRSNLSILVNVGSSPMRARTSVFEFDVAKIAATSIQSFGGMQCSDLHKLRYKGFLAIEFKQICFYSTL